MVEINIGDTYEREDGTEIEVMSIKQNLSEVSLVEEDGELVFDWASGEDIWIEFYSKLHGMPGMVELSEFCESVGLEPDEE